jgi:hypothetical protein
MSPRIRDNGLRWSRRCFDDAEELKAAVLVGHREDCELGSRRNPEGAAFWAAGRGFYRCLDERSCDR